jgi:hypothetical protein
MRQAPKGCVSEESFILVSRCAEEQVDAYQFNGRGADQSFLTSYVWGRSFQGNILAYDVNPSRFTNMCEVRPFAKGMWSVAKPLKLANLKEL